MAIPENGLSLWLRGYSRCEKSGQMGERDAVAPDSIRGPGPGFLLSQE